MRREHSSVSMSLAWAAVSALGVLALGCATARPDAEAEIGRARVAYFRAEAGPATVVAADELRDAKASLELAERVYRLRPDDPRTADLAYLASRRCELVESHAGLVLARRRRAEALRQLEAARSSAAEARK